MSIDIDLADEDVRQVLVAVIGFIIAFPILLFQLAGPAAVQVFSVITSSILTLGLVLLYFQQYSILDKQTTLMHRDYQSAIAQRQSVVADGDNIRVKLKNSGRGKVRRLFLKSEITSETGDLELDYGRVRMRSTRDGSFEIPAKSEFQDYEGKVNFRWLNADNTDPDRPFSFSLISQRLAAQGIETVRLKLTIEVIDEGVIEDEFSYTINIVDQELKLNTPEVVEGERQRPSATSVEDGIDPEFSSSQELNRYRWDEFNQDTESSEG